MRAVNPMDTARSDVGSDDYDACSILKGTEMMEHNSEGSLWFKPVPSYKSNKVTSIQRLLNWLCNIFILYYT